MNHRASNILNNLARNRTILANERTFLAYIRTAIMLAVSGVTLIKFFGGGFYFLIFGVSLLPAALILLIFGFVRFRAMTKRVDRIGVQEEDVQTDNLEHAN